MEILNLKTKTTEYPIYIDNSFAHLKTAFIDAGLNNRKVIIITDSNVEKIYLDKMVDLLKEVASYVCHYSFPAGEVSKNLDTVQDFYQVFLEHKLDRKSVVVALGGGVVGDMAGFAAATFMRGISFVQIPTTLLSAVDSSVGGKVGVDFLGSKNIVGAFYQPRFVYINMNTLKTLDSRQFNSGMAEVIKYGLIVDGDFYTYIGDNEKKIKDLNETVLTYIIKKCCAIKAEVVLKDEKEELGHRDILNFGHTLGHSIESLQGFKMLHGECVAIGMVGAAYLSYKKGTLDILEVEALKNLLTRFELPVKVLEISYEDAYNQMFFDKKVSSDKIKFILLSKFGTTYGTSDLTKEEIMNGISYIL